MRCLLLALVPWCIGFKGHEDLVHRVSVDIIEVNQVYQLNDDGTARKGLLQVIFWEWKTRLPRETKDEEGMVTGVRYDACGYVVVDWRKLDSPSMYPRGRLGRYLCIFMDKSSERVVEVSGYSFRETHTLYDPEIDDRKVFPMEFRRKIR